MPIKVAEKESHRKPSARAEIREKAFKEANKSKSMAEERKEGGGSSPPRDDVLRKRDFQRPRGIDLGSFMIDSNNVEEESESIEIQPVEEVDEAVGEVVSLFSKGDELSNEPGAVQRDGTVQ